MAGFLKHAPAPGEAPNGICECGCGQPVNKLSMYTSAPMRYWKGYPVPYLPGHRKKAERKDKGISKGSYQPQPEEIPSGVCECGCGLPTPITNHTNRKTRHFTGYPSPYLRGHTPGRFKSGVDSHKWKGGRIYQRGHVLIHMPDDPRADSKGYVFEHRVIWEQANGRSLQPGEHIHHINGVPDDNRPENLAALTRREHSKIHGPETFHDYYAADEHKKQYSKAGRKGAKARWHPDS